MPKSNSGSKHIMARHVAPFAPVAIAALMSSALLGPKAGAPGAVVPPGGPVPVACEEVQDFEDCHSRYPAGCTQGSGKPNYDAYLNVLKNQLIPPASVNPVKFLTSKADYAQLDKAIPAQLASKNHLTFKDALIQAGETQPTGLIGYLFYVKAEGAESSNCQLPQDQALRDIDYHIGIGFDQSLAAQLVAKKKVPAHSLSSNAVIVEMTPHFRANFEEGKWTVPELTNVLGRKVKVVGQLMVDNEHNLSSQNCAMAKSAGDLASCWRMSVWELHPVISFQVCKTDACTQNSTDWVELDQFGH
ncbi:MAG TPA: hypothetical protein VEU31_00845 [Candidatus Acidoferrales bacterium]|nr:hypothetical protein [Candidatus Acidoferrales bacterium]